MNTVRRCMYQAIAAALIFASVGVTSARPAAGAVVGTPLMEALQTASTAQVVVALELPPGVGSGPAELPGRVAAIRRVQDGVLAGVDASDFQLNHRYQAVAALAGRATPAGIARLAAQPQVARIDLDVGGGGALDDTVPLIDADEWHRRGITGESVVVAVLDSGLDTDHDDLADDLAYQACFVDEDGTIDGEGECPNGSDRQFGPGAAEDGVGHGTWTTGVVTSRGTVSPPGVAPGADIVAIKVLDDRPPSGRFASTSEIVAALDFIITDRPDVDVINMSLGTDALFDGECDSTASYTMAMADAIDTLRANGVIAFASSMNNGSATQMALPACLSNVVSVGATTKDDTVWSGTNSNTTLDLLAPGVSITTTGLDNGTAVVTGTSFASPHAAGCAALLIDAGVATSPDAIESRLKISPVMLTDPKNGLTFPRIDCFNPSDVATPEPPTSTATVTPTPSPTATSGPTGLPNVTPTATPSPTITPTRSATATPGVSLHLPLIARTGRTNLPTIEPAH